jgi:RNA exonuclease 1
MWSCCGSHVSSPPCTGNIFHSPRHYFTGEIECLWQFHPTPPPGPPSQPRAAVAIDCEMGTAKSGDSELIRVTVIDYFSSSVLVDRLVYPNVEMEHYNTRFSGVTRKHMAIALRERICIMGRDNARREVWRFVGPDTIVVGHSASNDLTALRWIHPVVVDTFLIESAKAKEEDDESKKGKDESKEEEDESKEGKDESKDGNDHSIEKTDGAADEEDETAPTPVIPDHMHDDPRTGQQAQRKRAKGSGKLSLQALAMRRLGREIQMAGKGHDSLEDATAARDLVHWHVVSGQSVGQPEG